MTSNSACFGETIAAITASLEALYSDESSVLVPATVASAALFLVNLRLLAWGRGFGQKTAND